MDLFKKKRPAPPAISDLREALFGDVSLETWAQHGTDVPWSHFRDAAHARARGDDDVARAALRRVVEMRGLESRQYLQAWHALRELGDAPSPSEAKHVYGVVLDVPVETGVDTLAAYEDRRARYFNYSGKAIIWESPSADPEAMSSRRPSVRGKDHVPRSGRGRRE
jgi:hypothetical protein